MYGRAEEGANWGKGADLILGSPDMDSALFIRLFRFSHPIPPLPPPPSTTTTTMDIDTDWCLTCERRLEYSDRLYCSPECQPERRKESSEDSTIFHVVESSSRWAGNDFAGISAWAAQIPTGAAPASPLPATPSVRASHLPPPPNLIKPSRRLVPPTLSKDSPQSPILPPSTPIQTPKRQPSFVCPIQTRTSMHSAATESSLVATPPPSKPVPILSTSRKQPSVFEGVYTHFLQSWASHSPPPLVHTNLPPFPPPPYTNPPAVKRLKIVAASEQLSAVHCMRPHHHDEHEHHPSFRTRGRKASRVAA